jgi:hypothetical protein
MVVVRYAYTVSGLAAGDQAWEHSGVAQVEGAGSFPEAVDQALRQTFMALTRGQVRYGEPGAGLCQGPYRIGRMLIEEVRQDMN